MLLLWRLHISVCRSFQLKPVPRLPPLPWHGRYVFLLDARGRLRWRASGSPSEQELQTLGRVTEQLLREQGEQAPQLQQMEHQAAQQQQQQSPGGHMQQEEQQRQMQPS